MSRETGEASPSALATYIELILARVRSERPAHDLVADVVERFRGSPLIAFAAAHQALADRDWAGAVAPLEELAAIDGNTLVDELAYDQRLFEEFPANALGVCWFRMGDDAESARWFARAEAAAPGVEEYTRKRQLAQARAGARHTPSAGGSEGGCSTAATEPR